ncbi:hypothetical protein H4S02_002145 [Coemansia sp. RSA 2611]|nr:hypothetical protein H4S01_002424 [Coemansia sp. RSA 2610]KAJ2389894.1 hypothetical protein H4S02_002145 [Coemansia sp. RSA 2611]
MGFLGACTDVDAYEKLCRIGEGTYGIVYKARCRRTRRTVALKRMRIESHLPLSSFREIALLRRLHHPNIVSVLEIVAGHDLETVFMVMEYCEHDLGSLLDGMDAPFAPVEVQSIMRQVLQGLAYCHARSVVHRDLKLPNLLMTRDGVVKIADFGLARQLHRPRRPMTPQVVTLWYRAPELILGATDYSAAVDMWSVGCIFGELLTHKPFMPGTTEAEQMRLIAETIGAPSERIWPGFSRLPLARSIAVPDCRLNNLKIKVRNASANAILLLNGLLTYDPLKRISIQRALAHGYFVAE